LGIEFTPIGDGAIAVHAVPSVLRGAHVAPFIRDLIDRLGERDAEAKPDALLNDLLAMMACKAAVKAGDRLNPDEINALIGQRHLIDKPASCPHGRPTMLRLTKNELNRRFKRT